MRKTVVLIAYLLAVLVVVTACQTPAGRSAGQVVDDGTITTGRPLTAGNKVTLLVDGPATHGALFKAIEGAKDHINFETFVFADNGRCSNRPWFYTIFTGPCPCSFLAFIHVAFSLVIMKSEVVINEERV